MRQLTTMLYPGDVLMVDIPGPNQNVADPSGVIGGRMYTVEVSPDRTLILYEGLPLSARGTFEALNTKTDTERIQEIKNGKTDKA